MSSNTGTGPEQYASGGVGPPGSVNRRRLLQGVAAAGASLGAVQIPSAATAAAKRREHLPLVPVCSLAEALQADPDEVHEDP